MTSKNSGQKYINELIKLVGVSAPPIPVDRIAKLCGAQLRYEPFDGDISGIIYRETDTIIIGINSSHPSTRQRFSIAHEIGHLKLHDDRDLHIDRSFQVQFRDSRSSQASDIKEIEANKFAAQLLMPEEMLRKDWHKQSDRIIYDYENDSFIAELANRYQVSLQAMIFRLINLKLIVQN